MKMQLAEIAQALNTSCEGDAETVITSVAFDSRKISQGALFVPIKGERDGHDFVGSAIEAGASATLWEAVHPGKPEGIAVLEVADTLKAMQDLALALRSSSHGALDAARYSGETLKMLTRGQLKMNMEVLGSEAPLSKLAKIINRLTIGIIIAGLFIGSSMLSLSSMEPRLLGVPVLAFFGYLGAAVLSVWVVFDISKRKL